MTALASELMQARRGVPFGDSAIPWLSAVLEEGGGMSGEVPLGDTPLEAPGFEHSGATEESDLA